MIKYWNKWEGINWLDLKKIKNHYWECSPTNQTPGFFFSETQKNIFKGYCTLGYTNNIFFSRIYSWQRN